MSDYWAVGDLIRGAGTPTLGEPYVLPTVNSQGLMCDMEIEVTLIGPRRYEGVVRSIQPVEDQTVWDIWKP